MATATRYVGKVSTPRNSANVFAAAASRAGDDAETRQAAREVGADEHHTRAYLEAVPPGGAAPKSVVVVLFGATGDLAGRMVIPAIVECHERHLLPTAWELVGCSADDITDEEFREKVRASLTKDDAQAPEDIDEVLARCTFANAVFGPEDAGELPAKLEEARERVAERCGAEDEEVLTLFFLAVPPVAFPDITLGLGAHGMTEGARVVFEKPYGRDAESFEELDATVKQVLEENQVFRIDHFLGKEAVQAMYALRFANKLIGSEWDRHSVAQVQIDVPEDLDVANRIGFYEATGAALDMIVTHLFQVASQVAMNPPSDLTDPESILYAREDALRAFRPLDPEHDVVLGQFEGYRDYEGVDPDSTQDTYVAARLWVDTERWRGVPFLLRTGKRMRRKEQRVTLVLKPPAGPLGDDLVSPNTIQIDISGAGAVAFGLTVKAPGPSGRLASGRAVLNLGRVGGGQPLSAYASLIHDVLTDDRSLFTTADGLRAAFRAFAPLQGPERPDPEPYAPGSWGPAEARRLAEPYFWMLGD